MEVKEAADLLDNLVGMVEDSHGADYDTALRMGIEALMESGDIIYRQAAIDAIRGWVNKAYEDWGNAATEIRCFNAIYPLIMALPSAQPSLDEWCYSCSEFDAERHCCPRWNRVIRKTIEDVQLELKKDVIQKFHDYQVEWLKNHYDIELEPQLEELIVRFLHDTADMYMIEMERRTDETD